MNMTIRFPDGSMSTIMQQVDGKYLIIMREKDTFQVSAIRPDVSFGVLNTYLGLAKEYNAKISTEFVA